MTKKVRVMVLAGNGINCEMETAHACRLAGADDIEIVYLWDLAAGKANLSQTDLLCLPGGFLDGDDLGAARASAIRIRHTKASESSLASQIEAYIADGGLAIGICNGFQLMVKLGLLPVLDGAMGTQQVTLTWNDSGRFEDRWVNLIVDPESPCVFTKNLDHLSLPIRHGEGKIIPRDMITLEKLNNGHQVPLRYMNPATGEATETYPYNPNGSIGGMAALTDPTGRLLGMMPHPEAFLHRTNHPKWTRMSLPEEGQGLAIFEGAVEFIRNGG